MANTFVLNVGYKKLHDNIYGDISVSNLACRIIDSKPFQRLRDLNQLGTCYLVFHGAIHKRFDHKFGTYRGADLVLKCIVSRTKPSSIEKYLKSIPELQHYFNRTYNGIAVLDDYICELVKLAGLSHDLGHGPFSHVFDDVFLPAVKKTLGPNDSHEERSGTLLEYIIKSDEILSKVIQQPEIQFMKNVINPKKEHTGFLYQIISNSLNGLDVDKYDYIVRDSANVNFKTGFDPSRLMNDVYIIDNIITYPKDVIYDGFRMYQSRYDLHKQIYTHKGVIAAQFMIVEIMILLDPILKLSEAVNNVDEFCKLTDNYILQSTKFLKSSYCKLSDEHVKLVDKAHALLERLNTHNLYVFIDNITLNKKTPISIDDFKKLDDFESKYESDIIIYQSQIGYVSGNKKNPFDNMFACSTKSIENQKLIHINKNEISQLLSESYQEYITLVFYKVRDDEVGKAKIGKWFEAIKSKIGSPSNTSR
jgi:HD superfamily phosphohydrolase